MLAHFWSRFIYQLGLDNTKTRVYKYMIIRKRWEMGTQPAHNGSAKAQVSSILASCTKHKRAWCLTAAYLASNQQVRIRLPPPAP